MLLSGSLSVREFSVEIESIALKSDGPVELSFASQVVTVQRCTLVSEDTRFSLSGSASLKDDRRLDLHASGHLNLKLAQSLSPDLTSYGASNVDLTIGGTASNPVMSGRVDIVHAGLSMIDLPAGLGDVNGSWCSARTVCRSRDLPGAWRRPGYIGRLRHLRAHSGLQPHL